MYIVGWFNPPLESLSRMSRKVQVRFLGDKGGVTRLSYPTKQIVLTLGEILKLLETNIFPIEEGTKSIYRQREETLKRYINLCFEIAMQNINRPDSTSHVESFYQKTRVEYNIKKISDYINYLSSQLDKEKILNYYENQNWLIKSDLDIDISYLIHHSYYGSILIDILWADDITVFEAMELSAGKLDLEKLGKKLPNKVRDVKQRILPFFKNRKVGKRHYSTLEEAINCYENRFNKGANLLLMTSIEGIVRDLGEFLVEKQGLKINAKNKAYNSLDSFLRKIEWKNDFEIDKTELSLITGEYELLINQNVREPFEKVQINLKTRLDFLRRRFKEDRDLILHGIESDYGKDWHLFVNFSALSQVYETVKYYDKKYK